MGVIVDQSPPPGTIARRSARVHISVLHPRDPRAADAPRLRVIASAGIPVPDVRGVSFAEAWDRLVGAGLLVRLAGPRATRARSSGPWWRRIRRRAQAAGAGRTSG